MSELSKAPLPLGVRLDRDLLATDPVLELLLPLLRQRPWLAVLLPWWLLRGRDHLLRELARRGAFESLDIARWPCRPQALARLQVEHSRRSLILLATGGGYWKPAIDRRFPALFDAVTEPLPPDAFEPLGSSAPVADEPGASGDGSRSSSAPGSARVWLRALRLHQWLKNLLLFAPLIAAHRIDEPALWRVALLAFFAFGLCASAIYLINDLLDLDADRAHPRKRDRPFASGALPLLHGLLAAPLLLLAAFAVSALVGPDFSWVLLLYLLLTSAYSLKLKSIALLDVMLLSTLYTLRLVAGAVAVAVPLSHWLLAFALFLFFSLALLKRYTELLALRDAGASAASGRGYGVADAPLLLALGAGSGLLAVLVLALYINSPASQQLYANVAGLWLLCPLLMYWISHLWLRAHRGRMHDDPLVFALRDPTSLAIALLGALSVALSA